MLGEEHGNQVNQQKQYHMVVYVNSNLILRKELSTPVCY
jgi:hypothetical protein